ncbi:hypothetical protein AGRA3207_006682 [Actinomadura graeca]|uniref:Chaplin n=1 Tax=Actinomadura graeca TaxID=2750812 RepID=A0ABX8R2C6_9ACTN|nr:hypothetical protein [Actinomadura graeca]QXJ25214.1 hypothetical protein AGRA3207_006682 [Actinomadura graeca]
MKRRVSIAIGGLASAALLTLAPAVAPQAQADTGPIQSNGNSLANLNLGLCGNNVPVLSVPVVLVPTANQNTDTCAAQGVGNHG